MQTLTRVFEFDASHRIMNEKLKCYNLHGHRFKVEVTFKFNDVKSIGYAIDFKEIKRIAGNWIETHFDHTMIVNPHDVKVISLCREEHWNLYKMGLGITDDINPSAENIASEIFYCLAMIFNELTSDVTVSSVRLYETPSCWVDVTEPSYVGSYDFVNFLKTWAKKIGYEDYDIRNAKTEK